MNEIESGRLVEIAADEDHSLLFLGKVCFSNADLLVLKNADVEGKEYDGYTIFPLASLQEFRFWDEEEVAEFGQECEAENPWGFDDQSDFAKALGHFVKKGVLSIYESLMDEDFVIGEIESFEGNQIDFKAFGEEATQIESIAFGVENVAYFCFGSSIEAEFEG